MVKEKDWIDRLRPRPKLSADLSTHAMTHAYPRSHTHTHTEYIGSSHLIRKKGGGMIYKSENSHLIFQRQELWKVNSYCL